jgi:hypothetical protein
LRRAITDRALSHEVDIGVILIGRPMALEVIQECRPVGLEAMGLEIVQQKRKGIVDANQSWSTLGQSLDQPFGDAATQPVFACGKWWQDFRRLLAFLGHMDAQTLETGDRGLRP